MKIFNLVYKIKNPKTEKKLSGGSSQNGIYLNKKMFIKSLPSCKYVNPLGRSYLKRCMLCDVQCTCAPTTVRNSQNRRYLDFF